MLGSNCMYTVCMWYAGHLGKMEMTLAARAMGSVRLGAVFLILGPGP